MTATLWLLVFLGAAAPGGFDDHFTGATLRVDTYHTGTAAEEIVSLDQARIEGEWAGSRTRLLDETNLGKYLFVVLDAATNRPLYSRGYCSVFGEWETIGEARASVRRTFHESVRFPEPRGPFQLVLKKRADDGTLRELFSTRIDPASRFVDRSGLEPAGKVWTLFGDRAPRRAFDLLVLGDGYRREEAERFRTDAARLVDALFATEPFRSRRSEFTVRASNVPSRRSGVTDPRRGTWVRTRLGLAFNAFDLDRYMLTYRNRALREAAAPIPYDALVILANSEKYGGGGIFGLWATCAARSSRAEHVFVHELGHSLAGLADEYYTSRVAYEELVPPGVEPWEPNVTALLDVEHLKWRDLVIPGTPLPTPWKKDDFDCASEERSARARKLRESGRSEEEIREILSKTSPSAASAEPGLDADGRVGAFEGANYQAKGLFRPELRCIMFSPERNEFCRVCRRAIEHVIDRETR